MRLLLLFDIIITTNKLLLLLLELKDDDAPFCFVPFVRFASSLFVFLSFPSLVN